MIRIDKSKRIPQEVCRNFQVFFPIHKDSMSSDKAKLYQKYYSLHEEYVKRYGEKVAVLMQVGKFFEMYAPADYSFSKNFQEISAILNCTLTKKEAERMSGFPLVSLEKNIKRLTDNDFTVVVVEQVESAVDSDSDDPVDISQLTATGVPRRITRIVSKGTNLENNRLRNNIMSIFYQKFSKNTVSFGISIIDIGISNEITYHDIHSTSSDKVFALDSARRFVAQYDPVECVVTTQNGDSTQDVIRHLGISCPIFERDIQSIDMSKHTASDMSDHAKFSVCALMTFLKEHKLEIAHGYRCVPFKTDRYLDLCSTAIKQLDLPMFLSKSNELNMTLTAMGNRLFTERILIPIKDISELNKRYDAIENLNDANVKTMRTSLRDIPDLDKIHTRLSLGKLTWGQFQNLNETYDKIMLLLNASCDPQDLIRVDLQKMVDDYRAKLRLDSLNNIDPTDDEDGQAAEDDGQSPDDDDGQVADDPVGVDSKPEKNGQLFSENIFVKGAFPDLDEIFVKLQEAKQYINTFMKEALCHIAAPKCKGFKVKEKMGLITSALRADLLKTKMKVKVTKLKKTVIVYTDELRDALCLATDLKEEIDSLTTRYFADFQRHLHSRYNELLHKISFIVAELDFIQSGYSMRKRYRLVRPVPLEGNGILEIQNARHLLIEHINQDRKYIPNDCLLGKDTGIFGMVLYGVNSCGKTSFLKSIGLMVVMAQAGLFVPASSMRFTPVSKIMTRIAGGDNMERSQSSYIVELEELSSMIQRSDENTLILGDEMCRGTEVESANAMVYTTLKWLLERKSFVIAATHLHSIADDIKNLKSAAIYHMKVAFDDDGDVIYDRKLASGTGPSKYGLEIAQAMGFPEGFMKEAIAYRSHDENKTVDEGIATVSSNVKILPTKKSRYNSKKILVKCQCCGYIPRDEMSLPLDTHHIEFQCNADHEGFHGTSHKNALHNLLAVCKECHCKIHKREIEVITIQGLKGMKIKFQDKPQETILQQH